MQTLDLKLVRKYLRLLIFHEKYHHRYASIQWNMWCSQCQTVVVNFAPACHLLIPPNVHHQSCYFLWDPKQENHPQNQEYKFPIPTILLLSGLEILISCHQCIFWLGCVIFGWYIRVLIRSKMSQGSSFQYILVMAGLFARNIEKMQCIC